MSTAPPKETMIQNDGPQIYYQSTDIPKKKNSQIVGNSCCGAWVDFNKNTHINICGFGSYISDYDRIGICMPCYCVYYENEENNKIVKKTFTPFGCSKRTDETALLCFPFFGSFGHQVHESVDVDVPISETKKLYRKALGIFGLCCSYGKYNSNDKTSLSCCMGIGCGNNSCFTPISCCNVEYDTRFTEKDVDNSNVNAIQTNKLNCLLCCGNYKRIKKINDTTTSDDLCFACPLCLSNENECCIIPLMCHMSKDKRITSYHYSSRCCCDCCDCCISSLDQFCIAGFGKCNDWTLYGCVCDNHYTNSHYDPFYCSNGDNGIICCGLTTVNTTYQPVLNENRGSSIFELFKQEYPNKSNEAINNYVSAFLFNENVYTCNIIDESLDSSHKQRSCNYAIMHQNMIITMMCIGKGKTSEPNTVIKMSNEFVTISTLFEWLIKQIRNKCHQKTDFANVINDKLVYQKI